MKQFIQNFTSAVIAVIMSGCITTQQAGTTLATLAGLACTPTLQKQPEYIPVAQATATALLELGADALNTEAVEKLAIEISEKHGFDKKQKQFIITILNAMLASWTDENGNVGIDIKKAKPYVTAFARGLRSAATTASMRSAPRFTPEYLRNRYSQENENS